MKEKNLDLQKQVLYQMMKDELIQYGYSEFRYVSEGIQGQVVLAKETHTNKRFAIKGIPVRDINGIVNQAKQDQAQQEKDRLLQCRGSPYVSYLIKAIDGTKFTFLVLTECIGTLNELIDSLPDKKLNEISAIKYCKDIAEGLHYIHSKKCLVNDLKFENILIDYNGNAVISDFGFAQTLPKTSGYSAQEYMGNLFFQAPECFGPNKFKQYDKEYKKRSIQTHTNPSQRSEACSLGYILYVMVQGFEEDLAIKKHEELPYDKNFETFTYKKQLRYIINGLTQFAPRERLAVKEVLILLKGIISFEFDLDQKFVELISQDIQEQANQLNQEIEFIQNFNNKYYPIFKNEISALQGLESSQDEVEKLRGQSKNLEYQINSLKAFQVEAESKIQEQDKIIIELETIITKLTQEIQSYQQKEAPQVVQQVQQQYQVPQMSLSSQQKKKCKCEAKGKCQKEAIKCSQCGHKFCRKGYARGPYKLKGGYVQYCEFYEECGKYYRRYECGIRREEECFCECGRYCDIIYCGYGCCECQCSEKEIETCEFDCDCKFCKK